MNANISPLSMYHVNWLVLLLVCCINCNNDHSGSGLSFKRNVFDVVWLVLLLFYVLLGISFNGCLYLPGCGVGYFF